jgi:hypothetical protein
MMAEIMHARSEWSMSARRSRAISFCDVETAFGADEHRSNLPDLLLQPPSRSLRLAFLRRRIGLATSKPVARVRYQGCFILFLHRPAALSRLAMLYLGQGLLVFAPALRVIRLIVSQNDLLSDEGRTRSIALGSGRRGGPAYRPRSKSISKFTSASPLSCDSGPPEASRVPTNGLAVLLATVNITIRRWS